VSGTVCTSCQAMSDTFPPSGAASSSRSDIRPARVRRNPWCVVFIVRDARPRDRRTAASASSTGVSCERRRTPSSSTAGGIGVVRELGLGAPPPESERIGGFFLRPERVGAIVRSLRDELAASARPYLEHSLRESPFRYSSYRRRARPGKADRKARPSPRQRLRDVRVIPACSSVSAAIASDFPRA
jgi:hypothetical protein